MDKNSLSSFLLGLGVGVGIGMLLAPRSGAETRDYLRGKANEGGDYLKQRSDDLRQTASEWVDRGRDVISRQRETFSEAMEAGRQAYRETVNPEGPRPSQGGAPETPAH
jgi:gas vesicle protein